MRWLGLPIVAIALTAALATGSPLAAANAKAPPAPDPMQFARGAKAWADNCGRCHNIRDPKEFSDKDWNLIVMHMRVRANLSGQEAKDIAAFLKASN